MSERGGRGRGSPQDHEGSKRKRGNVDDGTLEEDSTDIDINVHQQLLNTLRTQNNLLNTQNNILNTQTNLLRSIDAHLGRMERGERQLGRGQSRRPEGQSTQKSVPGSWKFSKPGSFDSTFRALYQDTYRLSFYQSKCANISIPSSAYGEINGDGLVLTGHNYWTEKHPSIYFCMLDQLETWQPLWAIAKNVQGLLAQLAFNDKSKLMLRSGIYSLVIKYNVPDPNRYQQDAGIIVGEVDFNSAGYALAEGADWDKLLTNQKQTQLPYSRGARGISTWRCWKICEPWEDGDLIKLKIDTNENTLVFQRGDTPAKTLWNVLAFTNNPKYPEHLCAFAYCGAGTALPENEPRAKLTIVP